MFSAAVIFDVGYICPSWGKPEGKKSGRKCIKIESGSIVGR